MKQSSIIAILIGCMGTILFTALFTAEKLSEPSYVVLLSITALVALVVHGFPRIKELDLKNLKLTLEKLEETNANVEDLRFSQGLIKAQFSTAKKHGFRFEDIKEGRNTETKLPELRKLADEYLSISVSDWAERTRLKNEAAVEMAAFILSNRMSKALLADESNEGILLGLAGAMYSEPESTDFELIKKFYKRVSRLHVRWRIVAVIELMLIEKLIGKRDADEIRKVLDLFSANADKSLVRKISKTKTLLDEVVSN